MARLDRGSAARVRHDRSRRAFVYGSCLRHDGGGGKTACGRQTCDGSRMDARKSMSNAVSVNTRAATLVERLVADAAELKVGVARGTLGERLIDCGSRHLGSIAAGLRVAEICMGGFGRVALELSAVTPNWPWTLVSRSSNPVIACLASQYAG